MRDLQHTIPERSVIIVEDIINMSKEEEVILRFYLNEYAHHKTLKIFCVGHTLYKTGLYGMLSLFNYILFTATPSNLPLLKQALAYFRLEKDEVQEYVEQFSDRKNLGQYYYLDCQEMKMKSFELGSAARRRTVGPEGDVDETHAQTVRRREKGLLERFGSFFEDHPEKVKARSLLCIIIRAVPESLVRDIDLTVEFASATGRKNISLIDYISNLLELNRRLDAEQQVLHNFIKSKCQLPKYLVTNRTVL